MKAFTFTYTIFKGTSCADSGHYATIHAGKLSTAIKRLEKQLGITEKDISKIEIEDFRRTVK